MIELLLTEHIAGAFKNIYNADTADLKLETTRQDFEGDYTFVVFPYLRYLRLSKQTPEQTAETIGKYLLEHSGIVSSYNVVKGFLNVVISNSYWNDFIINHYNDETFGYNKTGAGVKVMVEYSSPNTNKPLHLGHIRNNLLGWSIAELMKANGHEVVKVNLVNDRGIHICKSMLAWLKFGNKETPESSGMKGDKLVGKYYVEFDKVYKTQIEDLVEKGRTPEEAEKQAPLILEAQEMLRKWEAGDEETIRIWKMMNGWVYAGFDISYKRLGVDFDRYYYESDTYLLGKDFVMQGLAQGVFYQKEDGSVWIDLTDDGLDHKLVIRADGTSVYITQDLGTAQKKYEDFGCDKSIYVVGNEQEYHFKVLKLIMEKLGKPYAKGIQHFSYGMVDLPSGKMKSREGTVVDADDLMDEVITEAAAKTSELGKAAGLNEAELQQLYHTIGLGALKYYILKVDPVKRMMFNPAESIELNGNTGPFIQYTYARTRSLLRNFNGTVTKPSMPYEDLQKSEMEVALMLYKFPLVVEEAGKQYSPALIANYVYELTKAYNRMYHDVTILKEQEEHKKMFRLCLTVFASETIRKALHLLGIGVVEQM